MLRKENIEEAGIEDQIIIKHCNYDSIHLSVFSRDS